MPAKIDNAVLRFVASPDYRPMTVKKLAKALGVDPADYPEFRKRVRRLNNRGKLELGKDKTVHPVATDDATTSRSASGNSNTVLGTFRRTSRGFGFVRPLKSTERSEDIFIPEKDTRDASSGDEVLVKLVKGGRGAPGHGRRGRIVEVVERASGVFVGTYFEEDEFGFVKVDGTTFQAPIFVGDPGAKGARPGDKVVIEMVRFPSPELEGEAVLTEVLGPRGQPGVDTLMVLRAYNIPEQFDDEALTQAREQARHFDERDSFPKRLDLRDQLTVTIDPETARDFDDAITLRKNEQGFWELGVHIADVSHFVRPNSAIDREARKRGTSVYLPDRVIPMLPEILSNSLASLQEGKNRLTVSALMEFTAEGVRSDARFARSIIRVDRRLTYETAYEAMMNPERDLPGLDPQVRAMLAQMLELAMILRRRRFERGALELSMPEVEVDFGERGEVVGAHLTPDDESHQVIEEFMVGANEAVAEYLTARGLGFLRRGHDDPEPRRLREFAEFARSLGYPIESPQSRFELQRVLNESAEKPERHAVHFGLLRSLKRAEYTPETIGHYALASTDYCHFTSPIRRYPDLQVHRTLLATLAKRRPKEDPDELLALAEHATRTERRADAAEQELIKIKLLTHLLGRIGERFQSVIIGVQDFGFFCQLIELPIDGLTHITSLRSDYYDFDAETHSLVGRRSGRRFRLGDRIDVVVWRVDIDRRELDLVLADPQDGPPVRRPAATPSKKSRRSDTATSGPRSRGASTPSGSKSKKRKRGKKRKPS